MTTFLLVRHAAHDNVGGFLAGRSAGVRLGPDGRAQASRLGERMRRERFSAIHASPQNRTQETAQAISVACQTAPVVTEADLDEIDFGNWSGRTFDDLNTDGEWRRWNTVRSLGVTPAGDTMLTVQNRAVSLVRRLAGGTGDDALVLVTHADVIKAIVGYFLQMPIDAWPRLEIGPASISTLVVENWSAVVAGLNEVVS